MALPSLRWAFPRRFFRSAPKKLLGCSSIIQDTGFFHQKRPGDSEKGGKCSWTVGKEQSSGLSFIPAFPRRALEVLGLTPGRKSSQRRIPPSCATGSDLPRKAGIAWGVPKGSDKSAERETRETRTGEDVGTEVILYHRGFGDDNECAGSAPRQGH